MSAMLCAVLLGGVTLPPLDPILDNPYIVPSQRQTAQPRTPAALEAQPDAAPGRLDDDRRRRRGYGPRDGQQAAPPQESPATRPSGQIPLAPTDVGAADYPLPSALPFEDQYGTAEEPTGERPTSGAMGAGYGPAAPTSRATRPSRSRGQSSASRSRYGQTFAMGQFIPNRQPEVDSSGGYTQSATPTRPFSDYQPGPTVSPYLNLFDDFSGIARPDNYYTLVRPMLDQRNANRRIGTEMQGLQRDVRRLGTPTGGGTLPPYYQNLGGYYPGFNRR
jgi:hypothetical protein